LFALGVVAVMMLRQSLADVVRPVDPALALAIDADNAEVAASRAEQLLRLDPSNRAEAEKFARRALRRSPVSASGARMLATARDVAGDLQMARELMAYAENRSRRDFPTQVWLIEEAVNHNDIPRALQHYDIALRSSEATKPFLFPVLVKAIGQPPVVDGLIDTLSARPLWADAFLVQAGHEATDLHGLARLIAGLAERDYPVPFEASGPASARMVEAARYEDAWAIYAAMHHGAVREGVRDHTFINTATDAGPFAWRIIVGDAVMASPRRYGAQNALAYAAETGSGGVVARQLLLLSGGRFQLAGRLFDRRPDSPPAQIRLTCANSGQAIASMPAAGAVFSQGFAVPTGCTAQWLEVVVDGGGSPLGASGVIGNLHVQRELGNR
jgi:hypothetical protein